MRGNRFEDPINGITYRKLLPYGRLKSRKNALAPDSMSLERHRLMWLFMKEKPIYSSITFAFYTLLQNIASLRFLKR